MYGSLHGELGNQPTVDAISSISAVAAEPDPTIDGELSNQPTVDAITSISAVAASTEDFDGLIAFPMLCEVVSIWDSDTAQESKLRSERVAALRARWTGKSFTGLSWLPSLHVSPVSQYTTDTDTGECKIWDSKRDYKYDFKRTRALFEAEVPEALPSVSPSPVRSQYYTDESTGECKSQ